MGARLVATNRRGWDNQAWTLEIHDSDYVSSSAAIELAGFEFDYGETKGESKVYYPISACVLNFTIIVETGAHATALTDMLESPEGEYTVIVKKSSNIWWAGQLIADRITERDMSTPTDVQLSAVDGLGILKNVEYWNAGTAYTGYATLLEHIQNILGKTQTQDHWSATDDYLITGINWFADHHTVTTSLDPLTVTRVNHEAFYKVRDDGQKDHMSCYEVLSTILTAFGANIRLSEGSWRIHQLTEYANSTQRRMAYYKSGLIKTSSASNSYDVDVDQARTTAGGSGRFRSGGAFTSTEQLRAVRLIYNNSIPTNLALNQTWNHITGSNEISAGLVSAGSGGVKLKLSGTLNTTCDVVTNFNLEYRHKFKILIKVGSNYFHRESVQDDDTGAPFYFAPHWDTDPGYYEYWTPILDPDNSIVVGGIDNQLNVDIPIDITTLDLPADGNVTIDFFREFTNNLNAEELDFSALNMTYDFFNTSLSPQGAGGSGSINQSITYESTNPDTDDNTKIDEYTTIIGDGPNDAYPGHLQVSDGSTWEASADWRESDTGAAYALGDLFCIEFMSMQRQPRRVYKGSLINQLTSAVTPAYPHDRLNIGSEGYFFMLSGTFDPIEPRLNGTFLKVAKDDTSVTVEDEVAAVEPSPVIGAPPPSPPPAPAPILPGVLNGTFTTAALSQGFIESIPISGSYVLSGQISAGDTAVITNPGTGYHFQTTVVADHPGGEGGVFVQADLPLSFPEGSTLHVYSQGSVGGAQPASNILNEISTVSANNQTDAEFPIESTMMLESSGTAGNGSVAGLRIDSDGVQSWDSSSTTAITKIFTDGNYTDHKALTFQAISTALPDQDGLFYHFKQAWLAWGDNTKTWVTGPSNYVFQHFGYNQTVTTGVLDDHFVGGSKYANLRLFRYSIQCRSYGSGGGNNTLEIYKNGVLQITAGFNIPLLITLGSPISIGLTDVFHMEVAAVRSTPPTSLIVEFEFII